MLLSFSVENYKNFKEKQTLYFTVAKNGKGKIKDSDKIDTNTFSIGGETFLKTSVIYGENGSGKSNLIKAIHFVKNFIIKAPLAGMPDTPIATDAFLKPFKLDNDYSSKPSNFEIELLLNSERYKYSFSVDSNKVYHEKLEQLDEKTNNFFYLFERKDNTLEFSQENGKSLEVETKSELSKLRGNSLFISLLASINNKIGKDIYIFFGRMAVFPSAYNVFDGFNTFNMGLLIVEGRDKEKMINFLNAADININNIKIGGENIVVDNVKGIALNKIFFERLDNTGRNVAFNLESEESEGTIKLFNLSLCIVDALDKGQILFIDELDSKLHFKLIKFIIEMFNNKEINKHNAQLVFTSHNTTILGKKYDLFRSDQVYVINRKENEESELYSLADFRGIQKRKSKEELLLSDMVGGNPVVGEFRL